MITLSELSEHRHINFTDAEQTYKPYLEKLYENHKSMMEEEKTNMGFIDTINPLNVLTLLDIIYELDHNGNIIEIAKNPVVSSTLSSKGQKKIYAMRSFRFDKVEEVINFFAKFKNSHVLLYQLYTYNMFSPETFAPKKSVMIRCAWDEEDVDVSYLLSKDIIEIEFITKEEMRI